MICVFVVVIFLTFFAGLQSTEPEWYSLLTSNLTEEQQKALMDVSVLADQRRAARESKKIEQQGGKCHKQQYLVMI